MKFSVIIPVWNNKDWLEKCFQSILDQTYTNYEVLIINDMSTEDVMPVIRKYEKLTSNDFFTFIVALIYF